MRYKASDSALPALVGADKNSAWGSRELVSLSCFTLRFDDDISTLQDGQNGTLLHGGRSLKTWGSLLQSEGLVKKPCRDGRKILVVAGGQIFKLPAA